MILQNLARVFRVTVHNKLCRDPIVWSRLPNVVVHVENLFDTMLLAVHRSAFGWLTGSVLVICSLGNYIDLGVGNLQMMSDLRLAWSPMCFISSSFGKSGVSGVSIFAEKGLVKAVVNVGLKLV